MITAVDTNVVLDVLAGDERFGLASKQALLDALELGSVMACDVVWAEVGGWYRTPDEAFEVVDRLGIRFAAIDPEVAAAAGAMWVRHHRAQGDGPRERVIADFLIGAHAWMRADRLLSRDRGFYRSYFRRLEVVDPTRS